MKRPLHPLTLWIWALLTAIGVVTLDSTWVALAAMGVAVLIVKVRAGQHSHVFSALRHDGIGVNLHYIPIHLQPYYQALGFKKGDFPQAEGYYQQAISLPLFPGLSLNNQEHVVSSLLRALRH